MAGLVPLGGSILLKHRSMSMSDHHLTETTAEDDTPVKVHKIKADEWGDRRTAYLKKYRDERDTQKWNDALSQINGAWLNKDNMVPVIMNALKNKATMGEIHEAMRQAQNWSFR